MEKWDWPIIISKMTRKGLKILTKLIAGLIGFHTLKYTLILHATDMYRHYQQQMYMPIRINTFLLPWMETDNDYQ